MIRKRKIRFECSEPGSGSSGRKLARRAFQGRLARQTVCVMLQALMSAARNPNCAGFDRGSHFSHAVDVTLRSMLEILEEKRFQFNYHKSDKHPHASASKFHDPVSLPGPLREPPRPNLAWVGVDELTYVVGAWQRLEARRTRPQSPSNPDVRCLDAKGLSIGLPALHFALRTECLTTKQLWRAPMRTYHSPATPGFFTNS